ncbi:MAG: DUF6659 family protein [Candidatus Nitrosocosmicus sp.]|nr:hypothetical protein [Candidatus Nitrosocosmicus sp.]
MDHNNNNNNNRIPEERRKEICDKIFNIDNNIRFVGLINREGEVIEGGFRKGIEPLLNQHEEQDMYLQSLSNITFFQSFSEKFGPVDYLIIKQQKISMLTFPYSEEILCLSASSQSNIDKIRDQILEFLSNNLIKLDKVK